MTHPSHHPRFGRPPNGGRLQSMEFLITQASSAYHNFLPPKAYKFNSCKIKKMNHQSNSLASLMYRSRSSRLCCAINADPLPPPRLNWQVQSARVGATLHIRPTSVQILHERNKYVKA